MGGTTSSPGWLRWRPTLPARTRALPGPCSAASQPRRPADSDTWPSGRPAPAAPPTPATPRAPTTPAPPRPRRAVEADGRRGLGGTVGRAIGAVRGRPGAPRRSATRARGGAGRDQRVPTARLDPWPRRRRHRATLRGGRRSPEGSPPGPWGASPSTLPTEPSAARRADGPRRRRG